MGYRDENFGLRIDSELKRDLERVATEARLSMSDLIHDCTYALLPIIDKHRLLWAQLQEHAKRANRSMADILLECIQQCLEPITRSLRETDRPAAPPAPRVPPPPTKYPPGRKKKT
jgi:hypothetical protein